MSIAEGDEGAGVINPLVSAETGKAALDLDYQHRPKKPVVAVIYSHSHEDHTAVFIGSWAGQPSRAPNPAIDYHQHSVFHRLTTADTSM
jgi:hypothetical protein